MSEAPSALSVAYDLSSKRRFAMTTALIGFFVGGAVALTSGGSIVQQLAATTLVATVAGGGLYRALCWLSDSVTGGTGYYRVQCPPREYPQRAENGTGRDARNATDDATLTGLR